MEVVRRSVKKEEEEEQQDMNKNVMVNHMAQMGFRVLGFVLSLVAAIVVGLNKQSKVVPLTVSLNLPPLDYTLTANWHYLSALV